VANSRASLTADARPRATAFTLRTDYVEIEPATGATRGAAYRRRSAGRSSSPLDGQVPRPGRVTSAPSTCASRARRSTRYGGREMPVCREDSDDRRSEHRSTSSPRPTGRNVSRLPGGGRFVLVRPSCPENPGEIAVSARSPIRHARCHALVERFAGRSCPILLLLAARRPWRRARRSIVASVGRLPRSTCAGTWLRTGVRDDPAVRPRLWRCGTVRPAARAPSSRSPPRRGCGFRQNGRPPCSMSCPGPSGLLRAVRWRLDPEQHGDLTPTAGRTGGGGPGADNDPHVAHPRYLARSATALPAGIALLQHSPLARDELRERLAACSCVDGRPPGHRGPPTLGLLHPGSTSAGGQVDLDAPMPSTHSHAGAGACLRCLTASGARARRPNRARWSETVFVYFPSTSTQDGASRQSPFVAAGGRHHTTTTPRLPGSAAIVRNSGPGRSMGSGAGVRRLLPAGPVLLSAPRHSAVP